MDRQRCAWVDLNSQLYMEYHDHEWGIPVYDDQQLFEMLILEGAQAGLSWATILNKRENYRKAFDLFDVEKIARYDQRKIDRLLNNPGIVRNRLKIHAAIGNAQACLDIVQRHTSFSDYLWQFVDGVPIINQWESLEQVPARTAGSDVMGKTLKKAGFKFVGSTICYAFMQAVGMVNDHTVDCFRYQELAEKRSFSERTKQG